VLLEEVCRVLEKSEAEREFFVDAKRLHLLEKYREKITIKGSVFTDEGAVVKIRAREGVLKKLTKLLDGGMKTCES